MSDLTDAALFYLIIAGYIFHHGGLSRAWEHFSDKFIEFGEKGFQGLIGWLR